ncbi:MAG: YceI family protein [Thermoanaerobaculia bacterium]
MIRRPRLSFSTRSFASLLLLAAIASSGAAGAAERTFTVGGESKNSNITFESESDFETILGHTNTAAGTVVADLDAGTATIDVRVPVAALDTGIELRNKHLQSGDWLDARKNPEIRFVSRSARKLDDGSWEISGDFSLHGVTHPVTVRAQVKAIPAAAAKAAGLGKGDWLRVSAPFEVKLSDHGVEVPGKLAGRVSDLWKVKLNLFVNANA